MKNPSPIEKTNIKPPLPFKQFKLSQENDEFMDQLMERMKKLSIQILNKVSFESEEELGNLSPSRIVEAQVSLQTIQNESNLNKVEYSEKPLRSWNTIGIVYYHRPTPQDLLYEEN